jgi:hypothetical protein
VTELAPSLERICLSLKRLAASRVLLVILPFLICIGIGVVVGFQGGLHNDATTAYFYDERAM